MALLGCGFDPGVTNIYTAYAKKYLLDKIEYLDILDCNGGDHGQPFATNFNPEINIHIGKYEPINLEKFDNKDKYIIFSGIGNHQTFSSMIKKNGLITAIIANIIDIPITKTKLGFSPSLNKTNIKDKKIKAEPKSGCIRVNIIGIKITKKT